MLQSGVLQQCVGLLHIVTFRPNLACIHYRCCFNMRHGNLPFLFLLQFWTRCTPNRLALRCAFRSASPALVVWSADYHTCMVLVCHNGRGESCKPSEKASCWLASGVGVHLHTRWYVSLFIRNLSHSLTPIDVCVWVGVHLSFILVSWLIQNW